MERFQHEDLCLRQTINMIQYTEEDGKVWPMDFEYVDPRTEEATHVHIDNVITWMSMAELKHGAVGDRFECDIGGRIEYVWYSKTLPRHWFILVPVSKEEYEAFYRLPGTEGE